MDIVNKIMYTMKLVLHNLKNFQFLSIFGVDISDFMKELLLIKAGSKAYV